MNFLGMGAMEIIVIMVVALIIFGPDKLPEMGAQAGKALRDFRNMTKEMTGEFEESITDVRSAMDEMKMTVADVQRETRDLATSVTEIADSAADEVRAGVKTVNKETAEIGAIVKPGVSAATASTDGVSATATTAPTASASNGQATNSAVATKPATTQAPKAASPAKSTAAPRKKAPVKPAKPSKADPLADLGGFDDRS